MRECCVIDSTFRSCGSWMLASAHAAFLAFASVHLTFLVLFRPEIVFPPRRSLYPSHLLTTLSCYLHKVPSHPLIPILKGSQPSLVPESASNKSQLDSTIQFPPNSVFQSCSIHRRSSYSLRIPWLITTNFASVKSNRKNV